MELATVHLLGPRRGGAERQTVPVAVEATAGLPAEVARVDVLLEERARPILVIAENAMHDFHDCEARVETDEVSELEGPHRLIRAELHRGVDVLLTADPFVDRVDRLVDHRE